MSTTYDVVVIGGGISGLVAAWRLQAGGARVAVLEAGTHAGGAIGTRREEGVLVESGPNSLLETTPRIGEVVAACNLAGERVEPGPEAKNRFILRGGRLHALPTSPGAFLGTPLFGWGAKMALFREPFVKRGSADAEETVAQFVRRRLGAEFLDYAINPFVAGVYAGDPERLSARAAFPRLVELEQRYGGLIRGQIAGVRERKRNPEKSKQAATMISFRSGMQTLTDAVAARLEHLHVQSPVVGLARTPQGFRATTTTGTTFDAPSAVVAVPAYVAGPLVATLAPAVAQALADVVYPPVAVAVSAYRREDVAHPLDGFGFLVPAKESRQILGTIFSSTLFPGRAPNGMVVVTTFVGGMRQPEVALASDEQIMAIVQRENAELLDAAPQAALVRTTRWARAIPQYQLGHLELVAAAEAAETALPGLHFCANWKGGISVGDCVKSAFACADRVAARLGEAVPG